MDSEKDYTDSGSLILTPWETMKSDWDVVTTDDSANGTTNVDRKHNALEMLLFASNLTFLIVIFYLFSCSLLLFGVACRLMSANIVTAVFHSLNLLENTLVAVAIGNFVSAIIQSSDETISIIISLLNNNRISFQTAIPIIFGSNVGSSMIAILFTILQINNRQSFRRAIGSATLSTSFNFWGVLILLPIEKITGFHYYVIKSFVELIPEAKALNYNYQGPASLAVNTLIQIDHRLWQNLVASNSSEKKVRSIVKRCDPKSACSFPFDFGIYDITQGLVICIITVPLIGLFAFLMIVSVKTLLVISFTKTIRNFLASFRVTSCSVGGLTAILVGLLASVIIANCIAIEIIVCLLVNCRFISVPLAYPFLLGLNLGTSVIATLRCLTINTVTRNVLYVTLCNLLFNIVGTVILYAVPWPRLPLLTAESFGDWAYSHRAFSVLLILVWFIFLPLIIILVAHMSLFTLIVLTVPFLIVMFISIIIYHMQKVCPERLPPFLRTWYFLPIWLRSFAPYERCFNFKRFKMLGASEVESTSDVLQYMESVPGESISVVMSRIRKESIFQPTNVLLKQAVDTTGTQFSMSKLAGKKKSITENSRNKTGYTTTDQSSSEGSLIEKYTPFQSGLPSAVDVRTGTSTATQSRLTSTDSSSVKILTPYSTTKFRVVQQPKSNIRSAEAVVVAAKTPENGNESYISITEEENEDVDVEKKENTKSE